MDKLLKKSIFTPATGLYIVFIQYAIFLLQAESAILWYLHT